MNIFQSSCIALLLCCLAFNACQDDSTWQLQETISLGKVTPIGIAYDGQYFWISDGDNNQIVQTGLDGSIQQIKTGFRRPMHIAYHQDKLYVPEYGNDSIAIIKQKQNTFLSVDVALDAPAGIAFSETGHIAIADFYNHQIQLKSDRGWKTIGKKGRNAPAEFHYPTDVHFADDELYVADAYNNRVQVFDLEGKHLRTFGRPDKMNAATGIFVLEDQVFVTDFENDRVLIYDTEGNLQQTLNEGLSNPTDLIVVKGELYVINYKGKNMVLFSKK